MFRTRVLVAIVALPILVAVIMTGGTLYKIVAAILLGLGVWEMLKLSRHEGYRPSLPVALVVLGAILLSVEKPDVLGPGVALGIILAMAASMWEFSRGDPAPLNGFAITLVSALTLGWLGSRIVALRLLPDGEWWVLLTLFCTFAVDTGAYSIGKPFGKHKMAPKISPKKSWEGFAGGVLFGIVFGALLGGLLHAQAAAVLPRHGLILGLLIAFLSPIGDLAISTFKRQARVKDSSHLIPGHGGVLDRLDTVLISAVIGFYYVLWFV